jgi:hypothetical protein
LVSTVLAPVARAQDQAPKLRDREEQPANEIAGSELGAIKPQIISSAALDLGILRLESAEGANAAPSIRQSLSLLNTSGFPSTLTRPRFSPDAIKDFRLPVEPQPQTSSGKKSKAGGLIIGLIGLGLIGGGAYLAATSKPVEHFIPAMTTCTGVFPNQRCFTTPRRSLGKTINGGRYGGFGLIVLGMGVAVAGFGKM